MPYNIAAIFPMAAATQNALMNDIRRFDDAVDVSRYLRGSHQEARRCEETEPALLCSRQDTSFAPAALHVLVS